MTNVSVVVDEALVEYQGRSILSFEEFLDVLLDIRNASDLDALDRELARAVA